MKIKPIYSRDPLSTYGIVKTPVKFKIDYEYEDLSEVDDFERQVIWRFKYLGIEPPTEKKRARQIYEKYLETLME